MSDYKLVPVELLNRLVAFRIGACFDAKGTYTKRKAEEYHSLRDELAGVLSAPPRHDLTELRALVEKIRRLPDKRGTEYLQGYADGKLWVATELEALIERGF